MSAIAALYNLDGSPADPDTLAAMAAPAAHRGPDGAGMWVEDSVGLAQLHLRVTPEAPASAQPWRSPGGRYVIAWDGRLDNRDELRRALGPSVRWDDAADAALVAAAHDAWGARAPQRLVGDFAYVLWDARARELTCVRDPLGVRLLHYAFDGRRLLVATEVGQLAGAPGVPRRLNEAMLGLYLCGSFGDGEMTFYQDVWRLPGGTVLVASPHGLVKHRYWDPDPADQVRYAEASQYAEHLRHLLAQAVRCRLRSVTPVAVLLSGGLDSGAVASLAGGLRRAQDGHPEVRAYFWTYQGAPMDESPFVEAITEAYDIPLTRIPVDDIWAMKPVATAAARDEPFPLPFEAMQCRGLEVARGQGVRVVLTGEGGDEAFAPGHMLYLQDWARGLRLSALWRDLRAATPAYRRAAWRRLRAGLTPRWLWRTREDTGIPSWLEPAFVRRHHLAERLRALQARRYRDSNYVQCRGGHPFFIGSDLRAAAYGVELRHPFWDARLVEFMVRIPPSVRVQGGRSKLLLKQAMHGVVPQAVLRRTPHGAFAPLLARGLREREAPRLERLLDGSRLAAMGAVNVERLRATYRAYRAGDDARLARLFWTFVTEEWLQHTFPVVHAGPQGAPVKD